MDSSVLNGYKSESLWVAGWNTVKQLCKKKVEISSSFTHPEQAQSLAKHKNYARFLIFSNRNTQLSSLTRNANRNSQLSSLTRNESLNSPDKKNDCLETGQEKSKLKFLIFLVLVFIMTGLYSSSAFAAVILDKPYEVFKADVSGVYVAQVSSLSPMTRMEYARARYFMAFNTQYLSNMSTSSSKSIVALQNIRNGVKMALDVFSLAKSAYDIGGAKLLPSSWGVQVEYAKVKKVWASLKGMKQYTKFIGGFATDENAMRTLSATLWMMKQPGNSAYGGMYNAATSADPVISLKGFTNILDAAAPNTATSDLALSGLMGASTKIALDFLSESISGGLTFNFSKSAATLRPPSKSFYILEALLIINDLSAAKALATLTQTQYDNMLALEFLKHYYLGFRGNKPLFDAALGKPAGTSWSLYQSLQAFLKAKSAWGATFGEQYNNTSIFSLGLFTDRAQDIEPIITTILENNPWLGAHPLLTPSKPYDKYRSPTLVGERYTLLLASDALLAGHTWSFKVAPVVTPVGASPVTTTGFDTFQVNSVGDFGVNFNIQWQKSTANGLVSSTTPLEVGLNETAQLLDTQVVAAAPAVSISQVLGARQVELTLQYNQPSLLIASSGGSNVYGFKASAASPMRLRFYEAGVSNFASSAPVDITQAVVPLQVKMVVGLSRSQGQQLQDGLPITFNLTTQFFNPVGLYHNDPTAVYLTGSTQILKHVKSFTLPTKNLAGVSTLPSITYKVPSTVTANFDSFTNTVDLKKGDPFEICFVNSVNLTAFSAVRVHYYVSPATASGQQGWITGSIANGCATFTIPNNGNYFFDYLNEGVTLAFPKGKPITALTDYIKIKSIASIPQSGTTPGVGTGGAGTASPAGAIPKGHWARTTGARASNYRLPLTVDSSGNVFSIGSFSGTVDFDPSVAGVDNHTATNGMFLTRTNADGTYAWTKSWSATASNGVSFPTFDPLGGSSVSVDHLGNIYITGSFVGKVDFDPSPTGIDIRETNTYWVNGSQYYKSKSRMFITRFNADGTYGWTKTIGDAGNSGWGVGGDTGSRVGGGFISNDDTGNIFIVGSFSGTVDFDPSVAGVDNHTGTLFVTRINADGAYAWTKTWGTNAPWPNYFRLYSGNGVSVDHLGNIFLAGDFTKTVDFDPSPLGVDMHTAGVNGNGFVIHINADGSYAWGKTLQYTPQAIKNDIAGNLFLTGGFTGKVDFDPSISGVDNHSTSGGSMFITKINANGTYGWTRNSNSIFAMNGWGFSQGTALSADSMGNVIVTGEYWGTVDFDPSAGIDLHTPLGGLVVNAFLIKFSSNGAYYGVKTIDSQKYNSPNSISIDAIDNIFIGGVFTGVSDLDPSITGVDNQTSFIDARGFVSRSYFLTKISSDVFSIPNVHYTSENLADGTVLLGAGTKTWNFQAGAQALTGLKAVQVSGDAGLGITQITVAVGNVAANQAFSVSVPVNTVHSGVTPKVSVWQLQDAAGKVVPISNSANNTFWLKLRTNHAPTFSPLQLTATGGATNQALQLPLIVNDLDGDAITYQVTQVTGTGSVTGNTYNGTFTTAGVHSVNITASDGIETVTKTITVVVHASTGVSNFFSDVTYPGVVDVNSQYSAIHYLALKGLVIGNSTANGQRTFAPTAQVLQAEALAMILKAAEQRGFVSIVKSNRNLPNLMIVNATTGAYQNFSWAAPYAVTAERLGMINDASLWNPAAPVTREKLARWMVTLLNLAVPKALQGANYHFTDAAAFTTPQDYQFALATSYHGYMGVLGGVFGPATAMTRGKLAMMASKVLRRPVMQNVVLAGTVNGTLRGAQVAIAPRQTGATITAVNGLQSKQIFQSTSKILDEIVNTTASHVDVEVLVNGVGSVGVQRIANLATKPLLIDTSKLGITQDTVLDLVYKLTDTASGVVTLYKQSLGVTIPDRDKDGVEDALDPWPDNPLYSKDANVNGIPDAADSTLAAIGVTANQMVWYQGKKQTYTYIQAMLNNFAYDGNDDDGDGVMDPQDAFPLDPAASVDTDGDGYPDAWNANATLAQIAASTLTIDAFIIDPTRWLSVVNQPPVPTSAPISTTQGAAGTSKITANDPNVGDTHSYVVSTAAANGIATINATGLASYTPNAGFSGNDSFGITVTDNGTPQKSGIVTINVAVLAAANTGTFASYFMGGSSLSYLNADFSGVTRNYSYESMIWNGIANSQLIYNHMSLDPVAGTFSPGVVAPQMEYRLNAQGWVAVDGNKATYVDGGVAGVIATDQDGSTTNLTLNSVTALGALNIKQVLTSQFSNDGGSSAAWANLVSPAAFFSANAKKISGVSTSNQSSYSIASYTYPGCTPLGLTQNCNAVQYWDPLANTNVHPTTLGKVLSINGSKLVQGNGTLQAYNSIYFIQDKNGVEYSVSLMANNNTDATGVARIDMNLNPQQAYGAYDWNNVDPLTGNPALKPAFAITTWNRILVNGKALIEVGIPASITKPTWLVGASKVAFAVQDGYVRQVDVLNAGASNVFDLLNQVALADIKASLITGAPAPTPLITSVSPLTAVVGVAQNYIIRGNNLAPSMVGNIQGSVSSCTYVSGSGNNVVMNCMAEVPGSKRFYLKSVAGGPAVINGSGNVFINVTGASPAPTPLITSVSPLTAVVGVPQNYTIRGSNLAPSMVGNIQGSVSSCTYVSGSGNSVVMNCMAEVPGTNRFYLKAAPGGLAVINGSGNVFINAAPASIGYTYQSPIAGNAWVEGSTHNIRWSGGPAGPVKISLVDVAAWAVSYQVVVMPTNSGSYSWTIPFNTVPIGSSIGDYQIYIEDAMQSVWKYGPVFQIINAIAPKPVDTLPPVINLIGGNITVAQGSVYNDSGATALDNIDGNISNSIIVNNSVNTSIPGIYSVTYNVTDAAGNAANQVSRSVTVVAQQGLATISVGQLNAGLGGTVQLPVNVTPSVGTPVAAFNLTVNYDGNILTAGTVNFNKLAASWQCTSSVVPPSPAGVKGVQLACSTAVATDALTAATAVAVLPMTVSANAPLGTVSAITLAAGSTLFDRAGLAISSTLNNGSITVSSVSATYNLTTGWNLLSFPLDLGVTGLSDFIAQSPTVSEVWSYSNVNGQGQWRSNIVGLPPFLNSLKSVQAGIGYWVKSNASAVVSLTGSTALPLVVPAYQAGWSLLGVLAPVADVGAYMTTQGASEVWGYNNGNWCSNISGLPVFLNCLKTLKPEAGYFIKRP